jgi:3-oxoacyl-[acyl-carrier-protein] synthase I
MSENVYIAGVGVISAIGNNVAETLHALENHQAGIGPITMLDTIHRSRLPVAEVKLNNESLANLTGMAKGVSRTALLSMIAAREAWEDAGVHQLDLFLPIPLAEWIKPKIFSLIS